MSTTLPPGPKMPRALQTAIWFRGAQWFMGESARRFGDTFTLRILHEGEWVVVSHPDHVKQVFTGDPRVFHAGEGNQILLPVLGPNSLLLLDENRHLKERKLLLPPFHGARMQAYGELMSQIAREEIGSWPQDGTLALRPRMQALTLEIILRAVFGLAEGERLSALRVELRQLLDLLTSPRMMVFPALMGPQRLSRFGPFRRMMARVDELVLAEIAERRAEADLSQREDIMSLLLQAQHEPDDSGAARSGEAGGRAGGKPEGTPMSERELRDELLTLLVAGHETTANALAWAVERLVRHPDKLDRLISEVQRGERQYLEAVVQETLRLRPVISIVARRLQEPVQIGEWHLPAGVTVTPSIYLMHRRPDIYPDPDSFRPERFLDGHGPGTYTWIPFGGGVRRCLGGAFAQYEMAVVLAELVSRRRLQPARPQSERVLRRAITETPRHDAEVVLA